MICSDTHGAGCWARSMLSTFAGPGLKGWRRPVISYSPASMLGWDEVAKVLIAGMPADVQEKLRKHEMMEAGI